MLAIIRILALFCYFIIINLFLICLCIVRPFHRNNVFVAGQTYATMAKLIGIKIVIRRDEKVLLDEPYIFIANHQNSYDLLTICKAALPGVVTMGKKSLKWIPIFGQLYWLSGNIMIDRKNTGKARDTLDVTAEKIRNQKLSVWLFPEGTRSYGRGLLPFKTGAFRLALSTGEPIVMVCASNTHQRIKLNRWDNGVVLIDMLAPLKLDDHLAPKQWAEYCHKMMSAHIKKLDKEVASMAHKR